VSNVRYKLVAISGTKERIPENQNYKLVTNRKNKDSKDFCGGLSAL
jgi:hypothetical protein